jgi:hypothetical protein
MTGYYDYVLGLIPATLFAVTIALLVLGIPLNAAVPVGGGASALLVGHALFINGPVDDTPKVPDAAATSGPVPSAD